MDGGSLKWPNHEQQRLQAAGSGDGGKRAAADGGFGRAQAAPAVSCRVAASRGLRLAIAWPVVAAGGRRSWSCLLRPWRDRAQARTLESERERAESERERVERRVPVLYIYTARRSWQPCKHGERHATCSAWCTVGTVHQFQISNSTSNIPLKPIFRASVTSKPRRVSKNSINKSCRSTYQLQLLFRGFGLNLNGSRVIATQSAALETVTRSQT